MGGGVGLKGGVVLVGYFLAVAVGGEAGGGVGLVVEGDNAKNSTVGC